MCRLHIFNIGLILSAAPRLILPLDVGLPRIVSVSICELMLCGQALLVVALAHGNVAIKACGN